MKTASRENPERWVATPSNRAPGAEGQNRSCSNRWAAKQEKIQPLGLCFFLTSRFRELPRHLNATQATASPLIQISDINAGVTVCRYSVRFQRQEKYARLTMIKDDIQLLYEYDRWANGRVLQAASALSPEQFTRDLGGSFVSVRDTLVHIIRSEWGWLTYWKSTSHSAAFLQDLWDEDNPLFRLCAFPDVTAVARK